VNREKEHINKHLRSTINYKMKEIMGMKIKLKHMKRVIKSLKEVPISPTLRKKNKQLLKHLSRE